MHIIPHLQEFTLCHYIFLADATCKLCLFTGLLVFFNVFSVFICICICIFVISMLLWVFFFAHTHLLYTFAYLLLPPFASFTILNISLRLSAVFYTPFILQVYLKVHIYLMWRLSAVSVAFVFLFRNLTQTKSDTNIPKARECVCFVRTSMLYWMHIV